MKTGIVRNFAVWSLLSILCLVPAMLMAGSNDEEYIVKKHDTLWDISSEKLNDPFRWQILWHENQQQIRNPDLIYPGQKLNIPEGAVRGKRSVGPLSQQAVKEEIPVGSAAIRGRMSNAEKMSAGEIAMHKAGPLVTREMLISSGAIVDKFPASGKIIASPFGKTIMGQGDSVYVVADGHAVKGTWFYVYGGPERIIHPVTGRFIGDLIRIKGIIEITGEEGGNTKAVVLRSYEDIAVDDLLGEYYPVVPVELAGRKPGGIHGYIVMLKGEKVIAAGGNIVYLDKGTEDGVAVGDLFDVITGEKPNITVGVIQVISARNGTSAAVIKTARDAIQPGDSFGN